MPNGARRCTTGSHARSRRSWPSSPGTWLFFPSYELLEEAHSRFFAFHVGKKILVERPEWTKAQRDGAIEALRVARAEGGAVLFAVQGGSLSEGVDYEGNVLTAVIVVGLPLSPPNVEVEALKEYYCRKFGFAKGYDYAYVFPAVNKVLQAAGRAIRSERDRRHHSLGGPSARTAVRAVPATRFRAKAVQGACVRDPYVPRGVAPDWFLG